MTRHATTSIYDGSSLDIIRGYGSDDNEVAGRSSEEYLFGDIPAQLHEFLDDLADNLLITLFSIV